MLMTIGNTIVFYGSPEMSNKLKIVVDWYRYYLTKRTFIVEIDEKLSNPGDLK